VTVRLWSIDSALALVSTSIPSWCRLSWRSPSASAVILAANSGPESSSPNRF